MRGRKRTPQEVAERSHWKGGRCQELLQTLDDQTWSADLASHPDESTAPPTKFGEREARERCHAAAAALTNWPPHDVARWRRLALLTVEPLRKRLREAELTAARTGKMLASDLQGLPERKRPFGAGLLGSKRQKLSEGQRRLVVRSLADDFADMILTAERLFGPGPSIARQRALPADCKSA